MAEAVEQRIALPPPRRALGVASSDSLRLLSKIGEGVKIVITVRFIYKTGIKRRLFRNARLAGSWDAWIETPMEEYLGDDGCPAFTATVAFDNSRAGETLQWGVRLDGPAGPNAWGVNLEVGVAGDRHRHRELVLPSADSTIEETYHFTWSRRLGAQKAYLTPDASPGLRFSVWAPNAQAVEVVFGQRDNGYIDDRGGGIDPNIPVLPLTRQPDGVWQTEVQPDFAAFVGAPYMFRLLTEQGHVAYRTDIFSRWQIGRGDQNPAPRPWNGDPSTLDGTVSCSVVVDQDVVRREFEPVNSPAEEINDDAFWDHEFTSGLPVATRIEDLIIYELHVGSLGYPRKEPGTLADAMRFLDHLVELGVNAVELLPVSEFSGNLSWGYGNTHHFVIESSAGGRDEYKHFVRECHRRGIAVIQDVVYNHFDLKATRAEWAYDSSLPEHNIYYWYEGSSSGYADPLGGYVNNGSSGFAPRYSEEAVRQLFISSAAEFVEEFHVDGLRVDLTQAIHRDNNLNANGWGIANANLFGQKLLREWSRTLRMIRPSVLLIAEDHTGWEAVTQPPHVGGLGFDATWFADFYHHLIGDADAAGGTSRLLHGASFGDDRPLPLSRFATVLDQTHRGKVVYHESHDEAGNAAGSLRTSRAAVNDAPLVGPTRHVAEARCRTVAGIALLSAGTPMFFMGEELVAQNRYRYNAISEGKEDLLGERNGEGARMFRYYQDLIRLCRSNRAARSHVLDVIHANDEGRVLAFTRRQATSELLVVVSLNNQPFPDAYVIATEPHRLPTGWWRETFNSDSSLYGGENVGNYSTEVRVVDGRIQLRIPRNGLLVFQRVTA